MKPVIYIVGLFAALSWGQLGLGQTPAPPTFNPPSQTFTEDLKVKISCSSSQYRIIYTTNGRKPGVTDNSYSSPITLTLDESTDIQAVCVNSLSILGYYTSDIATASYTLKPLPKPSADPAGGYYPGKVTVDLSVEESGSTLHYTLDGSTPTTKSAVAAVGGNVSVTPTEKGVTLKVMATKAGWDNSPVLSETYYLKKTAATPVLSPANNTAYTEPLTVTLTSSDGADIYYTRDGSDPKTNAKALFYSRAIVLSGKIDTPATIIRAYAYSDKLTASAEAKATYTYTPLAPTPTAIPAGGTFFDSLLVRLQNPLPGSEIRYTLNGSEPGVASPLYSADHPILLDSTRTLSAKTFAPAPIAGVTYKTSDLYRQTYQMKLSAAAAFPSTPGIYEYKDSLEVVLKAFTPKASIYYTLSGVDPKPPSVGTLFGAADRILLGGTDTTVIKALCITRDGTIQSAINSWTYVKTVTPKLPAPQSSPPGRKFTGSISVTISNSDTAAIIHYTTDGSTPTESAGKIAVSGAVLTFDTSTILSMKAFKPGSQPSELSEERYTLLPATPYSTPPPGTVASGTPVYLNCVTPGAEIWYTEGDSAFDMNFAKPYRPQEPIPVHANLHIQARSVLGTGSQAELSEGLFDGRFYVNQIYDDSLLGPSGITSKDYQITLGPGSGPADSVTIRLNPAPTESQEIHFLELVTITAKSDTLDLNLTPVKAEGYALYRLEGPKVYFLTKDFPALVGRTGIYALGKDTVPPRFKWISQSITAGDSTEVRLEIADQISNATFEVTSSAKAEWSPKRQVAAAKDTLMLRFKNPPGSIQDLWFQVRGSDWMNGGFFPKGGSGNFVLAQGFKSISTRSDLSLGEEDYRYELLGFPTSKATPLTLKEIAKANPEANFKAFSWNLLGDYQEIEPDAALQSGVGLWLASDKPLNTVKISQLLTTASDTDGHFKVDLHPGWNLIANPSLQTLWWPVSHTLPGFAESKIRAVNAFRHSSLDYAPSDSLEPWRGYFVYNRGQDSLVTLLTKQPTSNSLNGLAKKSSASSSSWQITMGETNRMPVTFGAYPGAQDRMGPEDEKPLPSPGISSSAGLSLRRDQHWLTGDFIAPAEGKVVAFHLGYRQAGPSVQPSEIRVWSQELPPGYQAWAWIPQRGLKQALDLQRPLAIWSLATDSMQILVGPQASLQDIPGFALAKGTPGDFSWHFGRIFQGWRIRVQNPQPTLFSAIWVQTDGKFKVLLQNKPLGVGETVLELKPPPHGFIRLQTTAIKGGPTRTKLLRN